MRLRSCLLRSWVYFLASPMINPPWHGHGKNFFDPPLTTRMYAVLACCATDRSRFALPLRVDHCHSRGHKEGFRIRLHVYFPLTLPARGGCGDTDSAPAFTLMWIPISREVLDFGGSTLNSAAAPFAIIDCVWQE